jgi:hypothetical protein
MSDIKYEIVGKIGVLSTSAVLSPTYCLIISLSIG